MKVHLVNPSNLSFGVAVITPRWMFVLAAARSRAGDRTMRRVEQRLTMLAIDHHWSNYLASMRWNRDSLDLVGLVGKNPLAEFFREAGAEFDRLGPRIEDQVVSAFEQIEVRADGVDWEQEGLLGPSSTWTYLVNDQSLGTNVLRDISNRPGVALWAVLFAGPILFLWGLREHWMRRRKRAARRPDAALTSPETTVAPGPTSPVSAETPPKTRRVLGGGLVLAGVAAGFSGSPVLTFFLGWTGFATLLKGSLLVRIGIGLILGQLLLLPFLR